MVSPGASTPVATGEPGWYAQPRIAADGKRFIANRWDPVEDGSDLWIYEIGGTAAARVTKVKNSAMDLMFGAFSPDGRRLGVSVNTNNGTSQCWIQPVGGGANEPVATQGQYAHISDWSADGKTVLIMVQGPSFSTMIDGTRKVVPLPRIDDAIVSVFSPDGKWLAHDAEGGLNEVFVTNYPAATASWQVSRNGGHSPFWSPDGGTLYFLSGDRIMAAAVRADRRGPHCGHDPRAVRRNEVLGPALHGDEVPADQPRLREVQHRTHVDPAEGGSQCPDRRFEPWNFAAGYPGRGAGVE